MSVVEALERLCKARSFLHSAIIEIDVAVKHTAPKRTARLLTSRSDLLRTLTVIDNECCKIKQRREKRSAERASDAEADDEYDELDTISQIFAEAQEQLGTGYSVHGVVDRPPPPSWENGIRLLEDSQN
jgi:hypothetical protein